MKDVVCDNSTAGVDNKLPVVNYQLLAPVPAIVEVLLVLELEFKKETINVISLAIVWENGMEPFR